MTAPIETFGGAAGGCDRMAALFADLAYEASRADGRLHVNQLRALRAVLEDVGAEGRPVQAGSVDDLGARVDAERPDPATRRWLWVTALWVAGADGRLDGAEAWLLCQLRQVLDLPPAEARRLWRMAARHRARHTVPPSRQEYRELRSQVAPAGAWPC